MLVVLNQKFWPRIDTNDHEYVVVPVSKTLTVKKLVREISRSFLVLL